MKGQGLHKIISSVAKKLENKVNFTILGDGGAKYKLISSLKQKYKKCLPESNFST